MFFALFKEDEDSPMKTRPKRPNFEKSEDLSTLNSSFNNSASKQEVLENKQDLLNLKEEFKKLKKSLIEPDPASVSSDDFQDFESYESQQNSRQLDSGNQPESVDSETIGDSGKVTLISHSGTCDSIAESHGKGYTPSMTSSGYGSQAVSTLTLSSEDSLSLRSNDDSDLHRMSRRPGIEHCSSGDSDGDDSAQGHSSAIRSEVIEEIEGQVHDLNQCSSNETLENLNVDTNSVEDITHSKNDEKLKVNDVESTDIISLKSDLTENDEEEEERESVQLHISEEDLSSTGKEEKEGNRSQDNVQCKIDDKDNLVDTDKTDDDDKCDKPETENQSKVRNSSRSTKGSDSSSNTSRGPLYSDSIDPYSLEAMEELEKLGDEFGPDNSEFVSMNETSESIRDKSIGKLSESVAKDKKGLDDSFMKTGLNVMPENQSTPIKREKRKAGTRSEPRQRPVSCIVTSDNDLLEQSLQERSKRNSLDCSDEHLSGRCI